MKSPHTVYMKSHPIVLKETTLRPARDMITYQKTIAPANYIPPTPDV